MVGPNGSGKTNFLEAISLLLPGRGIRSAKKDLLPLRNPFSQSISNEWAAHFSLQIDNRLKEISIGIKSNYNNNRQSRIYKVDGLVVKGKEISEFLSINWLTPSMQNIIIGEESLRRKFFDRMICSLDPLHKSRINKLEKLGKERFKLIENQIRDETWFSVLEKEIAELSIAIIVARQNFTVKLDQLMSNPNNSFFPPVRILWTGMVEDLLVDMPALDVEENFANYLKIKRKEGIYSLFGPSNSILKIWFTKSGLTSEFCSTGQQKSILVSIILAFSKLLSNLNNYHSFLLLDEVASHLDEKHFRALFEESLNVSSQIWMTGTNEAAFKKLENSSKLQYFVINDSNITQLVDM